MATNKEKRPTVNISQAEWDGQVAPKLKGLSFSAYVRKLLRLPKLQRGGTGANQYTAAARNATARGETDG